MRRWLAVALCALAATALVASAAYAHTFAWKTSAVIGSGDGTGAQGKVGSKNAACKKNRKVTLFKVEGKNRTKIGSDRTDADGKWRVDAPLIEGDYQVDVAPKTLKKNAHHKHSCKKGKSKKKHL
jgi:hypothetical protein